MDSSIDLPLPDWKNATQKSNASLFALVKGISSWSEDEVRGKFVNLLSIFLKDELIFRVI